MKRYYQVISFILVCIVIAGGVWLLGRPGQPAPDSAAHEAAVRRLLAPAGGTYRLPAVIEQAPAEPVFVNLTDLPVLPAVDPPTGEDEAWEGVLDAQQTAALQAAALNQPPDRQLQWMSSGPTAPTPGTVHFNGPDFSQCCGGSGGITPPDPEMAAGPDHLIVVVNLAFAIYDKSGTALLGPLPLTSLFGAQPECSSGLFDPAAVYDEEAGRFMVTIDANGGYFCVAVAQNSDPLSAEGWAVYDFVANSSGYFFDYPQVGIGRDALYMSGNLFDLTTEPVSYVASRLWAFDKQSMYDGGLVTVVERTAGSFFTPQPLALHGDFPAAGPHYFLGMQDFENGGNYGLIAWHDPFGSNSLTYRYVNLNEYAGLPDFPVNATQAGGQNIQANDWRPLDFEYRDGYGWLSQTVSCNPGSGAVNCVRWAKIRLATGAVTEGGLFASDGDHRIFPDLAVNDCGDMAIGYTKSSTAIYPAVWYTGRQATDQANRLQNEAELKAGELPYLTTIGTDQPPYRWGDYTGMTIDPDGKTFWYVGEYSKNTGSFDGRWGTYVGSFTYPTCPAVPQEYDYAVYLPLASRIAFAPAAGYWQAPPSHDFYVTADQAHVDNFGLAFNVPDCGDFKVVYPEPVPIIENRFAFDAVIYASGVFNSQTTAAGFDGLNNLYLPQCDVTITAGPFAWNATWASDEPPPPAEIVTDPLVQGITPDAAGLIVIPLDSEQ